MSKTYVIGTHVLRQPTSALRVQVVCEDSTTLLCSRDGERANTSEHVGNNVRGLEQLYKTIVFSVQPRIPINFGEIEGKPTIRLVLPTKKVSTSSAI